MYQSPIYTVQPDLYRLGSKLTLDPCLNIPRLVFKEPSSRNGVLKTKSPISIVERDSKLNNKIDRLLSYHQPNPNR